MAHIPLDTSCQAEYADGYIHDETDLGDVSPYVDGKNIFSDILEKRPEAEHGQMVRFSVFYLNNRHDIDWRKTPDGSRPIRFRHGFITQTQGGYSEQGWSGMQFGYQYNNKDGKNVQEVVNL